LFNGDAHLLASQESGLLDPSAGELDPGVKLRWLVQMGGFKPKRNRRV